MFLVRVIISPLGESIKRGSKGTGMELHNKQRVVTVPGPHVDVHRGRIGESPPEDGWDHR